MSTWQLKTIYIKHQNRWVSCIVDSEESIVAEISNLSEDFINKIIGLHNDAIVKSFQKGLCKGVEIISDCEEG